MNRETHALEQLARELGILTSYVDWKGEQRQARPEVLVRVLQLLGADIGAISDAPDALRAHHRSLQEMLAPPCTVAWNGWDAKIELCVPPDELGSYSIELALDSGETRHVQGSLDDVPLQRFQTLGDRTVAVRTIPVPVNQLGYHRATIHAANRVAHCQIIAAPRASHAVTRDRRWGVFAPLYGLRSKWSGGTGDLGDLTTLARRVGELGASFLATLPLLASYLDEPFEYSPYSPVSRLFWNELYLDPATAPGFTACEPARNMLRSQGYAREARALREMPLVDYKLQMAHKRAVLEELATTAWQSSELRAAIHEYAERHVHARDYARFRAKTEAQRIVWTQWANAQDRAVAESDYDERAYRYHLYVQFAMDAELAMMGSSSDVALYLDLPVGVNRCGYDTWKERETFVIDASAGAPPDALFLAGQNWGLAPLHPRHLRASGYQYFIECVRTHVEHAGLLRVDHVMGLHRLFWIPEGAATGDGVYVEYRAPEMYAILCLESARHECAIVGENLGTVPDYVPPTMKAHGVCGLYVGQFGMSADDANADELAAVPRDVVASLNTHDMPTFAGFWRGRDIDDRLELGLIAEEPAREERQQRAELLQETAAFLRSRGFLDPGQNGDDLFVVMRAVTLYLASSDARNMLVNLEDLWLETEPQNVPGTVGPPWSNWRRKLRYSTDGFATQERILEVLRAVDRARSS